MKVGYALAALLALASSIRLYGIDQPLVTFHATRHYRSAVIARACYYRAVPEVPQQAVRVAVANKSLQPAGEPPLMEWLACASYLALGREEVAIPRAFAVVFWVAGAIPLYFCARRGASAGAALVGASLYLFLPYGIVASRNFQPDALMTLASLWAILATLRHHERPERARQYLAAGVIAVAAFIKPMSVFLTIPVLLGLGALRLTRQAGGGIRPLITMLALALAPATLYYGYDAVFGTFARDQMHMRFVPDLLGTAFFWSGLWKQANRVFTLPLLALALLGAATAPTLVQRVLLGALWTGYAAFAVAFTYHMPTHDYYHWPYIAAIALGIVALLARLERDWAPQLSRRAAVGIVTVTCLAIVLIGSRSAWPRLQVPGAAATLERYREIGELTNHDAKVLFLDAEYGYPLMYHSEVSGDAWPNQDDLAAEALGGGPALDANTRFVRDFEDFAPRYFIATDMASLEAQPDLEKMLAERTIVVRRTPHYHVYEFVE